MMPSRQFQWPGATSTVTAVIAHFGEAKRSQLLVDDLLAQTHCPMQIVVVDDASPEPFPPQPDVEVMRHETNLGFGSAVNTGAAKAHGEWLLILNNDVRLSSDFIREALAHASPWQPAICGFRQVTASGSVAPSGPFPTFWRTLAQRSDALGPLARRLGWTRYWQLDDPARTDEREVDWIGGAALLLPLPEFWAVGGFDTRYFMYHEEIDLQRRLQSRGTRSVILGGLVVFHEGGASTSSLDVEEERLRSRLTYEELRGGQLQRQALEWGLRGVMAIDVSFHRTRSLVKDDPTWVIRMQERREALKRARHPRFGSDQ